MKLTLIDTLDENTLFKSKRPHDFNAKDMAELAFLYLIALHIMRSEYETALFAQRYAKRTMVHGNFDHADSNNTDLYQFLNVLRDHDSLIGKALSHPDTNELFWKEVHFSGSTARQLLSQIANSHYDGTLAKRLLMQLEQQFHITNTNYRSVRRLAGEWDTGHLDTEQKKLTVTRLLQAVRAKARRGDLLASLEHVANSNNYELTNVCDPETGKNCGISYVPGPVAAVKKQSSNFGFIKNLAVVAGIAAADHLLRKAAKS
jgi:hypothetical protein